MVLVALFLKYMFNVPCFFFMHTDWMEYIKCTTPANMSGIVFVVCCVFCIVSLTEYLYSTGSIGTG